MWTATLANILVASDQRWGAKWAWRVVRFVHALPFLALAFGFGIGFLPNDLGRRDFQHSGRGHAHQLVQGMAQRLLMTSETALEGAVAGR